MMRSAALWLFVKATIEKLLKRPEAAERLATSLRTLDASIASGDLEVIRIGRAVRIRESALELFIEARATRTNPRKGCAK